MGASATGQQIMASAAQTVKPIWFELGGKNSAVVFSDVDIDKAVAGVARSTFIKWALLAELKCCKWVWMILSGAALLT